MRVVSACTIEQNLFVTAMELTAFNRSVYKDEKITDPDLYTPSENFGRAMKHAWQAWMPNNPLIPFSASNESVVQAWDEKLNAGMQQYSLGQSLASSIGINMRSINPELRREQMARDFDKLIAGKKDLLRRLNNEFSRQSPNRKVMPLSTYKENLADLNAQIADLQKRKAAALQ
jgi:hypothetical protein